MMGFLSASFLLLGGMPCGYAQESQAFLVGRITDASGAVVPAAKIIAQSLDTGVSISSVSKAEGNYQIHYLRPGPYRVTVEAKGFNTSARDSVELRAADRLALDFSVEAIPGITPCRFAWKSVFPRD